MVRPIKLRRLIIPHKEIIFTPEGNFTSGKEKVTLLSEEYEVIKLVDYEKMHHLQASKIMGISRPTLTRIYEKARNKIAECLVELKELRVEGGNSILGDNWFKCKECDTIFNIPADNKFDNKCPVCFSNFIDVL
jgi:uncharacterized protein